MMARKVLIVVLALCMLLGNTLSAVTQCGEDNDVVVTETIVDNKIIQWEWIGTTGTAFVLTQSYTLYRSTDEGKTWVNQNPMMNGSSTIMPPQNRKGIQSIVKTSSNDTVYFLGWGGQMWSTQNRGDSYVSSLAGGNLLTLLAHPTEPTWLLADSKTDKCYNAGAAGSCYLRLHLTQDRGLTWRVIDTYISPNTQYTWANAGLGTVPKETIWVLDWSSKTGDYSAKSVYDLRLLHSVDFLSSTISHPVDNIIFMLFHNHIIYLAQQESTTAPAKLLISEDDGNTFNYANFPTTYPEQQYQILDDSEGSVFINVRHGSSYWGSLYHSNKAGSNYTLSMMYNKRDTTHGSRAEFGRLEGIDGIYVANSLENVPSSGGNTNGDARSMITFDKGGEWQPLSLPYDRTGQTQITCTATNCQLHLHGITKKSAGTYNEDSFGPLYSNSKAIGMMLGTGNVGQYMSNIMSSAGVYLTRDAGWTWYHLLNGSHIYEFSDYGALMLFANNVNPTDTAKYTWDQGLSMIDCKFTNSGPVEVLSIVAEPTTTAQSFVLHGYRSYSEGNTTGVIAHFDFSNLHERACDDNDYEVFVPYDSTNSSTKCVLGQTTSYTRRKRDSQCFNGKEFQPTVSSQACPCTREDYECDTCYEPVGSVCSLVADCEIDVGPPKNCDGYYYVSKGYRLIDGDMCNPKTGLDLTPYQVPCTSTDDNNGGGSGGTSGGIVALIIILILLLLVVLGGSVLYVYRDHEIVQKYAPGKVLDVMNSIGNRRQDYSQFLVNDSTALDEDLLTDKIADPVDDDNRSDSFI